MRLNDKRFEMVLNEGEVKTIVFDLGGVYFTQGSKLAIEKIEELKKWLSKNQIEPKSHFMVAQYNNPAVPGFLRRNEIIVEV